MTRIAIFLPSLAGGGAERSLLNVACGLAGEGIQVDLTLAKAEGSYLKLVPESVRVVDLNAPRTLASLPALAGYLRRERPTALLSALEHANVVAILAAKMARTKTRVVVSLRNTLSADAQPGTSWKKRLEPLCAKYFYPFADDIVAVSHGAADDLARLTGLSRSRIQVIYNPVVSPELHQQAAQPVSHPWLQAGQPPVLLAVGRLSAQKDYPTLLQAFALVRKQRPARLLILGEGEERGSLEALMGELGLNDDVQMPGFVDNPFAYMKCAAVVALSSRFEGLPGVLIQALACGTPVVSTDCPSGPNEILAGGKWGTLVPMSDPPALAAGLLAELSREKVCPPAECWQPFLAETSVRHYLDVLTAARKL